jgi:hypothetical protein
MEDDEGTEVSSERVIFLYLLKCCDSCFSMFKVKIIEVNMKSIVLVPSF